MEMLQLGLLLALTLLLCGLSAFGGVWLYWCGSKSRTPLPSLRLARHPEPETPARKLPDARA